MSTSNPLLNLLSALMTPSLPIFLLGVLAVLFIPVFLHFYLARTQRYTIFPSILLLGPAGSGKTSLLTHLERRGVGPLTETHTSQVSSVVELAVSEDGSSGYRDDLDAVGAVAKKFMLVDTPGHGKLRGFAMAPLLAGGVAGASTTTGIGSAPAASGVGHVGVANPSKTLKGIVFMVDSSTLSEPNSLANAAAYLYDVLLSLQKRVGAGKTSQTPSAIPVLVAVNKLDLFTALPPTKVKADLEIEMGRIRRTRSKGLLDSGVGTEEIDAGGDEGEDWLGEYGSDKFSFGQMAEFEIDVDFIGGSVLGNGGHDVDKWWSWMAGRI